MKQILLLLSLATIICFFASCASTPKVEDDEVIVKVSRDATKDDIEADDEMSPPVWANNLQRFKKEMDKKDKKNKKIWYSASSRVNKKHNLSTCKDIAKLDIQKELSESIKTAVDSSFAKTVRGEIGSDVESYAEGVIGAASKSIASGLKLEDNFWAKVMNKMSKESHYDCYVLYAISEVDYRRAFNRAMKGNKANIPKDREEEMKKAMERARKDLTN